MLTAIIIIFVVGYFLIALEHPLKVDKTATALVLGMVLWILYALGAQYIVPVVAADHFHHFLAQNPSLANESLQHQALEYVLSVDVIEHLGDITQTLLFLIGAMTIVELVDVHGGFRVITDRISTRDKRKLLWIIAFTTFFMSAILDNLTTTIVMILLLRKLISDKQERWLYAGAIVIAANTGGAWSPIGDVTTIMLWVKGNVTVVSLIKYVLIPSLAAMVIPIAIIARRLHGELQSEPPVETENRFISAAERNSMFYLGVGGLIFVPVFKSITHLPPFIGILLVLGALWIFTEIFYNSKKMLDTAKELRLPKVISRIDMPSILFFLGILMAVAVLEATGLLGDMAQVLDEKIHNVYVINSILGVLSSIVDNVPLVAGVMGMYPIADPAATGYAANFVVDGTFWELLSYCAGVGGSILIIGSAAGVIAMGLEKISFGWYLKNFSWLAFLGYAVGVGIYIVEKLIF
ncbi:MAG: sodium:proton antiporter [Bacteroidales bacterium]|nr:sodium:proton antiporter [Bacteroidales bacterium]MDE7465667.1 sodium:proton antiporter NhaD [Muribaculaceae bacterium]